MTLVDQRGPWALLAWLAAGNGVGMDDSTMVEVFRALGDPVRWTIVNELRQGTRCACVLSDLAEVSPSLLSHHLKTLREAGLIEGERRGRWMDYSLVPGAFVALSETLVLVASELGPDGGGEVCPSWELSSVS